MIHQRVVSLLIPVYNEERTIESVLGRASSLPYRTEIIVIDDCSTDRTPELLRRANDATVIRLDRNSGRGSALRAGITRASGEVVAFMDGDMEVDPAVYRDLIDPILDDRADVVIGSRFLSGAASRMSLLQRYGNAMLTAVANLLYRMRLSDVESGTIAFRVDVLRGLRLRSNRWDLSIETAARLSLSRARILEVPIAYEPRSIAAGKKLRWGDFFVALYYVAKYALARYS